MPTDAERAQTLRELQSLRIAHAPEQRGRQRIVMVVVALGCLLVIGAAGYETWRHTLGRPLEVETADVVLRGAGQSGVMLTGSGYVITRAKYITIGTKILGQIVEEPIEEGKHVKKGDLLARIDDRDYKAQLDQARADYALAVANVKLKRSHAKRIRELNEKGYASSDQLDDAVNQEAVAEATVERSKAMIDFAEFNVGQCTIRSPIDGVVLQKYREAGATINYGGDIQAGGGTTDIAQLAETDDIRVEVDINESDIGKVSLGMPANIVLDAYPQRTFDAKVVKIYPEANRQKGTVEVEVRFEKPDLLVVKPEMSAKVSFLATGNGPQQASMVLAPKKAIIGSGNSSAVWVVRDGHAERTPIIAGSEFQDGVEVRQGLNGGEVVIVSPPESLHNYQEVATKAE